jgi:hypothetical protein
MDQRFGCSDDSGGGRVIAEQVLDQIAGAPSGCVIMLASTEEGCGAYGRVVVDPWEALDVTMFGWPKLTPGDPDEDPAAVGTMLRLGFRYDGTDWTWRRPFHPALVAVAAHAVSRALAEVWQVVGGTSSESLVWVHRLGPAHLAALTDGCCERCVSSCGDDHG